jgi:glutamate-1-semialdehyde 2,1-aminomutase
VTLDTPAVDIDGRLLLKSDTAAFGKFFRAMLGEGVNLAPSQFEAGFMSAAHSIDDLDKTIEAARRSFKSL